MKYEAIFTIVDRGVSDSVIDAATKAGSTGGTIIHGRGGSGTQETAKLFNLEIEPEKDIILILSKVDKTEDIVTSIEEKLMQKQRKGNNICYRMINRTTAYITAIK